jgi:hypothetical protein
MWPVPPMSLRHFGRLPVRRRRLKRLAGGAKRGARPFAVHQLSAGCLLGVFSSGRNGRVHRVQIGVVYPQIELGGDLTAVRRFGRAVEELGLTTCSPMTMCWVQSMVAGRHG